MPSADEKPSIQARRRKHASLSAAPTLAARNSSTSTSARALGSTSPPGTSGAPKSSVAAHAGTGTKPFNGSIGEVMNQKPYRSAKRVFLIIDNCSVHRGQKCVKRLQARWLRLFRFSESCQLAQPSGDLLFRRSAQSSDTQRFPLLAQLEETLLAFQQRYEKSAAPFQWTFTREDLAKLMIRLRAKALAMAA